MQIADMTGHVALVAGAATGLSQAILPLEVAGAGRALLVDLPGRLAAILPDHDGARLLDATAAPFLSAASAPQFKD